jgi:hypothetical protein
MATTCIPQTTFGFEPKGMPIVAAFDQPHASSDGGAVLLKSLELQGLMLHLARLACVHEAAGQLLGQLHLRIWCGNSSSGSRVARRTATTPPGGATLSTGTSGTVRPLGGPETGEI